MTQRHARSDDRNPWLRSLAAFRRTPKPDENARPVPAYRAPPSRQTRKALTTWQDEAAIKQLKHLASDLGVSQQALIAEGINLVLAKYAMPTVAK